jgi:hypothetical protein
MDSPPVRVGCRSFPSGEDFEFTFTRADLLAFGAPGHNTDASHVTDLIALLERATDSHLRVLKPESYAEVAHALYSTAVNIRCYHTHLRRAVHGGHDKAAQYMRGEATVRIAAHHFRDVDDIVAELRDERAEIYREVRTILLQVEVLIRALHEEDERVQAAKQEVERNSAATHHRQFAPTTHSKTARHDMHAEMASEAERVLSWARTLGILPRMLVADEWSDKEQCYGAYSCMYSRPTHTCCTTIWCVYMENNEAHTLSIQFRRSSSSRRTKARALRSCPLSQGPMMRSARKSFGCSPSRDCRVSSRTPRGSSRSWTWKGSDMSCKRCTG